MKAHHTADSKYQRNHDPTVGIHLVLIKIYCQSGGLLSAFVHKMLGAAAGNTK